MRSPCDVACLDAVMWCVSRGARLFQRVALNDAFELRATAPIPRNDVVCAVPAPLALTVDVALRDPTLPHSLRTGPRDFGTPLPWWPEVDRSQLALICWGARAITQRAPPGYAAHLHMLAHAAYTQQPSPLHEAVRAVLRDKPMRAISAPLAATCNVDEATFNEALERVAVGMLRRGTPLWTREGTGHPYFASSPFAESGAGDIVGTVPLIDNAAHSSRPNCRVGFPDDETHMWLQRERDLKADTQYVLLQSARAIAPGELITVDLNATRGMDEREFAAWFGVEWADEAQAARVAAAANTPRRRSGVGIVEPEAGIVVPAAAAASAGILAHAAVGAVLTVADASAADDLFDSLSH